jgi:hypothetical protein
MLARITSNRPLATVSRYSHTAITMMYAIGHRAVRMPDSAAPAIDPAGMPNGHAAIAICSTVAITPAVIPFILNTTRHSRNTRMGTAATRAESAMAPSGSIC